MTCLVPLLWEPEVVYDVQAFHVSDVEARGEPHWVESIKIEKVAEPEELGSWAG